MASPSLRLIVRAGLRVAAALGMVGLAATARAESPPWHVNLQQPGLSVSVGAAPAVGLHRHLRAPVAAHGPREAMRQPVVWVPLAATYVAPQAYEARHVRGNAWVHRHEHLHAVKHARRELRRAQWRDAWHEARDEHGQGQDEGAWHRHAPPSERGRRG